MFTVLKENLENSGTFDDNSRSLITESFCHFTFLALVSDEGMYGKRDYGYMDFDEMMDDEDEDPMGEGPGTIPYCSIPNL